MRFTYSWPRLCEKVLIKQTFLSVVWTMIVKCIYTQWTTWLH